MTPTETERLEAIHEAVRAGRRAVIGGLTGSSASYLLSRCLARPGPVMLVIAPNEREALALREDLEFFLRRRVPFYPGPEETAGDGERRALFSERLAVLVRLQGPVPPSCVVAPVRALRTPVPNRDTLAANALHLKRGDRLDRAETAARLEAAGLHAVPLVSAPAEYSIRGDVIDCYPLAFEDPLRVELFDEEIESIRRIDLESQRSTAVLEEVTVPLIGKQGPGGGAVLVDHLPHEVSVVTVNLPGGVEDAGAADLRARPGMDLHKVAAGVEGETRFKVLPARGSGRTLESIRPSLERLLRRSGAVTVLCQTEAEAERFGAVAKERALLPEGAVEIAVGRITEGFSFPAFRACFINHHELLQRLPVRRPRKARRIQARAVTSFTELHAGDLVVHLVHGIARYEGIQRMEREGGMEDFLTLRFDGDTLLYVPASKIHLVERYIGGEGRAPALDRLGSGAFARRKERVRCALRDLAADLLEVQAAREQERGFACAPDDELQTLFDASFPYEDTEDQRSAMEEIKADMESRRPMDRLLCGDVGFGKTELAVRAAFKTVLNGKQTAVLVPTTLLAQQHYETFRSRFADYPVRVEVLSRFRSRTQQKTIIEAAREGRVDVLIGTHRLLSRDVGFKDLGLLVIDEEQRFGVVHKERLKRLKRTVDVLTMTATPIPRTLHMALVGLRDISNLEIPPQGRMPIHTEVTYKSDAVIREALAAELRRGGQAYYLHNRVETIDREAERVRRLLPEARVAVAHGQMRERELERVMLRFIRGKVDVLLCTTIIESGIDLPAVNTIVVDRADTFGLADLHQLRGRVGRGNVRARAVFLVPRRPLPDVVLRRLKAVEELTHLGAGFQIALKDLEIRGAGNILGAEQHGHIAAVGYELYCRLLRETVRRMKGMPEEPRTEAVDLDLKVDAFIPAEYIPGEALRMEMLRRLGRCRTPEEVEALREEFRDRFGRPPRPLNHLLDAVTARLLMARFGIRRIAGTRGRLHLVVELSDPERYAAAEPFRPGELRFIGNEKAHLHPPASARTPEAALAFVKQRLLRARKVP